jgi:site-specific recombinase XerD
MISVNYYLKGALSESRILQMQKGKDPLLHSIVNEPKQVYLTISGLGKRMQIYTKKRIPQIEWNQNQQLVDCRKNKVNGTELNEWLNLLKQGVIKKDSANELAGKTTTIDDVRGIMDSIVPVGARKSTLSIQDYFDRFINEHKTGSGHSKKTRTVQKYNTFISQVKDFANKKKLRIDIETFDSKFLLSYKNYLVNDRKLNDNTVAKYIKAAKTFIRFYINAGLIRPFDVNVVKSTEKEGEIYIINLKQLVQLQNYKLATKRLDQCRDVFCFQCWTGQRYSDIQSINRKDIRVNEKGERIWDFFTVKTGENIKVPITEYAEFILKKYQNEDQPLPAVSNQKQNVYLKELGKLVSSDNKNQKKIIGFESDVKVVEYHNGARKESHVPFHEVLSTHVARKSYITNSLMIGVPERVVKEVSGHKSEKDFRRYVKLANSYKEEIIQKSFSKKNLAKFL